MEHLVQEIVNEFSPSDGPSLWQHQRTTDANSICMIYLGGQAAARPHPFGRSGPSAIGPNTARYDLIRNDNFTFPFRSPEIILPVGRLGGVG